MPKIVTASNTPKRQKGILTPDEVTKLFSFEWVTPYIHCHPSRPQFMGYTGNLLAATTGLRLGELQAITIQDLHLENGYIRIWRSWDNRLYKLNKTTKTGRDRNIFIPDKVKYCIKQLLEQHPASGKPDAFLFWGEKKPDEKSAEKKVLKPEQWIFIRLWHGCFFLPEKHRKMIRYYGIYAHKLDEKINKIETRTWAKAIENSFQKNSEVCPDCLKYMVKDTVYSFHADNAMKMLVKTHVIIGGYFKPFAKQVRSP